MKNFRKRKLCAHFSEQLQLALKALEDFKNGIWFKILNNFVLNGKSINQSVYFLVQIKLNIHPTFFTQKTP